MTDDTRPFYGPALDDESEPVAEEMESRVGGTHQLTSTGFFTAEQRKEYEAGAILDDGSPSPTYIGGKRHEYCIIDGQTVEVTDWPKDKVPCDTFPGTL